MPLDKITADSVLLVEGKDETGIRTLLLNTIKRVYFLESLF